MIPPAFDYEAPGSLGEAVSLLSDHPDAKILSGGQSLIPLMRFRLATPGMIVDINRIEGLAYIKQQNGHLSIGGLTREVDLEDSEIVQNQFPLLADTARMIADPLVRNRATVGGNLAHADPANDHPATMLAYRAEVVAHGSGGERVIPIDDFFLGPFEGALAQDEVLIEIRIPTPPASSGGAYFKLERKVGDYATAAVACQVTLDESGDFSTVGLGLTNVGLTPIRASAAEAYLLAHGPAENHLRAAAALAAEAADPEADYRGSVAYKRSLVQTLAYRALHKSVARARGETA